MSSAARSPRDSRRSPAATGRSSRSTRPDARRSGATGTGIRSGHSGRAACRPPARRRMTREAAMADLLLVNANVLTMDPARPRARAVAITGERISGVHDDPSGVAAGDVVDLHGATLAPGFHDAHNHMGWFGLSLAEVDLSTPPVGSLEALYEAVARRAESTPEGGWVVGSGYDQNKLGAHPDRDALDRAAPGRRVWLRHTSGHMCVVNSLILADLGMDAGAVPVPGGRVDTDASGRPTGRLDRSHPGRAGRLSGGQGRRAAAGPGGADGRQRRPAPAGRAPRRRP